MEEERSLYYLAASACAMGGFVLHALGWRAGLLLGVAGLILAGGTAAWGDREGAIVVLVALTCAFACRAATGCWQRRH